MFILREAKVQIVDRTLFRNYLGSISICFLLRWFLLLLYMVPQFVFNKYKPSYIWMALFALLCLCATGSATLSPAPLARLPTAAKTRSVLLRLRGGEGFSKTLEAGESLEDIQAASGEKLVVVDFTATWCGPCQRIAPVFAELAELFAESTTFVKVNGDRRCSAPPLHASDAPCTCTQLRRNCRRNCRHNCRLVACVS